MCGERRRLLAVRPDLDGSSPRVRGTPASASAPTAPGTVHPRVCGERNAGYSVKWANRGSSPRVRGTPAGHRQRRPQRRFIPACAGNATPPSRTPCAGSVHPRVCGERAQTVITTAGHDGSSPRVRGTPNSLNPDKEQNRFIPACAGNARRTWTAPPASPVHPRVCGERVYSSGGAVACIRFIPACAGNA